MKKIKFLIIIILAASCSNSNKEIKPFVTGKEGQTMPTFSIQSPDSVSFINTIDIVGGKPIVLFSLSTTCPYCRMETRRIVNNIKDYNNVRFYLVVNEPINRIKSFMKEFGIQNNNNNILIGRDTAFALMRYFNTTKVPFLAVYGKDKKLNQAFLGAINSKQLKRINEL